MFGRKKSGATDSGSASAPVERVEVTGPRADGPFDIVERPLENPDEYVDLGALLIKMRGDIEVQLPTEDDVVTAVLVTSGGSAVELRPFAGARSGGTWDGVRAELRDEVDKRGGSFEEVEGPFGTEVLAQFPAKDTEGNDAIQPARFIGIEGPRWVVRATILGAAGLESTDEGVFMEILRDLRVRRGEEPRILRESLPLQLPPDAQRIPEE
ncbi:DUF3710 domain-containing protein [Aeromicrobium duanguangcaii]|uniref:DUF3710 domain-containing protein n=1 Tax=Aeromicrobium duanguangcaii TaxID=2968086 RepID=A0ABY5KBT3_9ACTN|nr:DUF3710 domain-containing protein [Aeromicrobium duanguangcaii]MCL3837318.1 DUF3710 domain-containing protein [Aeromicrobium duanguangcaii]UUI67350.1 DUF3710 domain-containing protein [Aeromicrobium duanguangcaii]